MFHLQGLIQPPKTIRISTTTKNREKLLDKGNRAARDKGIGVQLCDVAVRKL